MTLRAFILGLAGAALLCGVTYFNDAVMRQTMFIGNSMPYSVFGGLLLFVLLVNPLLRRIKPGLELRGSELAVALAMILAAATIPGSGLMRVFTTTLMLPHHFERTEAGWEEAGIVEEAPSVMLANPEKNEVEALNGFLQGLRLGDEPFGFRDIPWYAWIRTLLFWLPLLLVFWIAMIALALVVHPQWAHYEHLPYPVAIFANALLPENDGSKASILSNRLFWIGACVVSLLYLNNYLEAWFPKQLIPIPTSFDFGGLGKLFPAVQASGGWYVFQPTFYFTAVAFAYFLASPVSFSVGVGPILWAFVVAIASGYGISMTGGSLVTPKPATFLNLGAYLGVFLTLLYTGRQYYLSVAKQALFLPAADLQKREIVWAARVFILALIATVTIMSIAGLDWQLSVLYVCLMTMLFAVVGRIIAETGVFLISAAVMPCAVIYGLMGPQALGPRTLLIMFLLTMIFLIDPRESLISFVVNGLRIVDVRKASVSRTAAACVAALAVGISVAVPVTLYFQYSRGGSAAEWWPGQVARMPFEEAVKASQRLEAQERLDSAEAISGFERLGAISPDVSLAGVAVIGMVLVLLTSAGRLRYPWFPIHPVLFLLWTTWGGTVFGWSFLAGWLIKVAVTKYGGGAAYQHLKPLMLGLIAGELFGGLVPVIVGFIYYGITGTTPPGFNVLPY